ncbi:MAG: hypothetical protein IKH88_01510 [Prevotella sp.]|nr:hypothetical protein [Prevotella sp.]
MKEMKMKSAPCQATLLVLVFVMMLVQASCMTKKTLAEQVVIHDTLRESHTDTVRLTTYSSRADTVRESKVQVITLRQDSAHVDTVRVETILEKWHMVYVTDTVNTFRHLADSLQAVFEKQAVKEVSVPRRHTMGVWCITLLVLAVVVTFLVIGQRKQ